MAKNSSGRSGNSKLRFIMLEADLSEGDLSQVTQAIQNALRPAYPTSTRVIRGLSHAPGPIEDEDHEDIDLGTEDEQEEFGAARPRPQKNSKPRPAKVPTVLNDIDVKSSPSLHDYISQFDLKTSFEKYLAIAHWFREARETDAVTVDHIYTCFRILSWPTGSSDFEKPLRNMRTNQWVIGGAKEGYTLTLTGADKIEKKKAKP